MAYFGRTPKKPSQTPGAGHGFVEQKGVRRAERAVLRFVAQPRAGRPERAGHVVRAARGARAGRSAR